MKDNIKTKEDEEHYRRKKHYRLCEKEKKFRHK